jgi:hypothetical protein
MVANTIGISTGDFWPGRVEGVSSVEIGHPPGGVFTIANPGALKPWPSWASWPCCSGSAEKRPVFKLPWGQVGQHSLRLVAEAHQEHDGEVDSGKRRGRVRYRLRPHWRQLILARLLPLSPYLLSFGFHSGCGGMWPEGGRRDTSRWRKWERRSACSDRSARLCHSWGSLAV